MKFLWKAVMLTFLGIISSLVVPSAKGDASIELTDPDKQFLVYLPNESITFNVNVVDSSPLPGQYLKILVTDIKDKILTQNTVSNIVLNSDICVPVTINKLGFFRIIISLSEPGSLDKATATTTFSIIPQAITISNEANVFGVNFHLPRVTLGDAEKEINMAERIGIGWGRGMLPSWDRMLEPAAGDYGSFSQFGDLLDLVEACNISAVGHIYYMPQWASESSSEVNSIYSRIMPANLELVTDFCNQWAAKCSFVEYWEVGNEVDSEVFWKGSLESYQNGDGDGAMRDYVSFIAAASEGFRNGNSSAKILFAGLTSSGTASYMPEVIKLGVADYFDIFNTHYLGDISVLQNIDDSKNVWVTEIGQSSSPGAYTLVGERRQIVNDVSQCLIQLAAGAKKVFKYDFRDDGINPDEKEQNFGLVYFDFSPKPSYSAYATMIRLMTGSNFSKELNILRNTDIGWLRGYAFTKDDGVVVNAIWLNNSSNATVKFDTPDSLVHVVDIMGNEKVVNAVEGKVSFDIDELPFFVIGTISDSTGSPVYPVDSIISTIDISLNNSEFDTFDPSTGVPEDWGIQAGLNLTSVEDVVGLVESISGTSYRAVFQNKSLATMSLPVLNTDEYLTFSVESNMKMEDVTTGTEGRGVTLCFSYYDANGVRIDWKELPYRDGSSSWELWKTDEEKLPAEATKISVQLYFAPGATGKIWVDDVKLKAHVWKKSINSADTKQRSVDIALNNSGFETYDSATGVPSDWGCQTGLNLTASFNTVGFIESTSGTTYRAVFQNKSLATMSLPALNADEYLTFSVESNMKMEDIGVLTEGRGVTLCLSYYDIDGKRIRWKELPYRRGCSGWELWKTDEIEYPEGATKVSLQLFFAPDTTGKVWIDNAKLEAHVWKKYIYPTAHKIQSIDIPVNNSDFESFDAATNIPFSWYYQSGLSLTARGDAVGYVESTGGSTYRSIFKSISLSSMSLPILNQNEYLTFSIDSSIRMEDVGAEDDGLGTSLCLSYYDANGVRLGWTELPYRRGTSGWELWQTNEKKLPSGAVKVAIELYFSPDTMGKIWLDDVKLKAHVWEENTNSEDTKIQSIDIPVDNSSFDNYDSTTYVPTGWGCQPGLSLRVLNDFVGLVESISGTTYRSVSQNINLSSMSLPILNQNEYLTFSVESSIKMEDVGVEDDGVGVTLCLSYYDANGVRLGWTELPYRCGTSGWELWHTNEKELMAEANKVSIQLFFAPDTTGEIQMNDVKLTAHLWKEADW